MAEKKTTIRFYYGDDDHSKALSNFIAKNIKMLMQTYSINQQKITNMSDLGKLRSTLINLGYIKQNTNLSIPFAVLSGSVLSATDFSKFLTNMTTKKRVVTQPESVSLEQWNMANISKENDDDEEEDDNSTSIAKKMERFNKLRETRVTDKPVSKKATKSFSNDEEFQNASGMDNVNSALYDFNSGENILEEMRLDDAISMGKKDTGRPRRKM